MNTFKTFLLLLLMTLLFLVIGEFLGGSEGMLFALFFAIVANFFSYWFSDSIVLSAYRAKEIDYEKNPDLHNMMTELAGNANVPVPKLYYVKNNMPNAFATGRNPDHAAVAVTSGILDLLDEQELRGVIAHELSHIKNRDILVSCVAAVLAGAITVLSRFAIYSGGSRSRNNNNNNVNLIFAILAMILAPIAAALIQMAVSRSREYLADETGASICKNPLALASALRKLTAGNEKLNNNVNPSTAHMFIVTPFSSKNIQNLFSTHPPIEDRIKRLEKMAEKVDAEKYGMSKVIY